MGATQSEQADFEIKLHALSREMLRLCYLNRPVVFDWYCNDYLYTDVRFLALIVGTCDKPKWMYPYEFWSISMGPVIQSRHFFRIRYHNGFYVLFDDEDRPFEHSLGTRIEELLRDDNELESVMERIRAICESTGVLLSPRFVSLTREARNSSGLAMLEPCDFNFSPY
jgi:hypothetical protein